MQIVVQLGWAAVGGPECVVIDGWAVVVVATLLTAPRLLKEWQGPRKG